MYGLNQHLAEILRTHRRHSGRNAKMKRWIAKFLLGLAIRLGAKAPSADSSALASARQLWSVEARAVDFFAFGRGMSVSRRLRAVAARGKQTK